MFVALLDISIATEVGISGGGGIPISAAIGSADVHPDSFQARGILYFHLTNTGEIS